MGIYKGGLGIVCILCAGCAGLPDRTFPPPPSPGRSPASPVDLEQLEAPGEPTNWSELQRLKNQPDSFAENLRRASLYLRVDRPEKAQLLLDRLRDEPGLDREHQAVVHYLKARVCRQLDLADTARTHRNRARRLTRDRALLERLDTLVLAPPPPPREPAPAATATVIPRSGWGARSPAKARLNPMGQIWRLTIHHTAMTDPGTGRQAVISHLLTLQRSHMNNSTRHRAWGDLGYHYLIDAAGRVWEGRSIRYQGAHAGNPTLNRGNIGICLLGNFQVSSPNADQVRGLRSLVTQLVGSYGIASNQILGHRDLKPNTACPGTYLYQVVQSLRARP